MTQSKIDSWMEQLEKDREFFSTIRDGLNEEAIKYSLYAKINLKPLKWSRLTEYMKENLNVTLQPGTIRKKVNVEIDKFKAWCITKDYKVEPEHIDEFLGHN